MKVRVIQMGYWNHKRRRPGEILNLKKESDFSHIWMEAIDWTPTKPKPARYEEFRLKVEEIVEEEGNEELDEAAPLKKGQKLHNPEPRPRLAKEAPKKKKPTGDADVI